jgi:hypothetical protein
MSDLLVFHPPRRLGTIVLLVLVAVFMGTGVLGLVQMAEVQAGMAFLASIVPVALALVLVPFLFYRLLALQRSSYVLERDGIHLMWGLRSEDIPMEAVMWVGDAQDLGYALPRPFSSMPGSVLGTRTLPDGKPVEFLASSQRRLVVIVTPDRAFAISPADPAGFLGSFRRLAEFGSLAPLEARSVFPQVLISRSWADRWTRILLVAGLLLALALLVWVSLEVPKHAQIALHISASRASAEDLVPGIQLMLLPVLNMAFFAADLVLGLYFYRHPETQPLAYLVWGGSVLASVLLLLAVYYILGAA